MTRQTGLVFYKMTGSGNDFVMLDGRHVDGATLTAEWIAATCDRRLGVGSDGLVIVSPIDEERVRMEYFNSDGSFAPMCGNAALCTSRLATYLEMGSSEGITLVTGAGEVRTRCVGPGHFAELCLPKFKLPVRMPIEPEPGESSFYLGTVGVPHLVVLTKDVDEVDIEARGRALRHNPILGPNGANISFISAPVNGDGPWRIRTYEKGIEEETLACGTGTVAAAFTLKHQGLRDLPSDWVTRRGFRLSVAGMIEGQEAVESWLAGEGRLVYTGILSQ
ncbi:MAG: diaminopimelate epimerase [Gemmatimonadales bacterium]|nr:MAG: diaminopimelate epimerase [Gemmatimonadales bacterium]